MNLVESLFNGSDKMYVPVQVRSMGGGEVRLQVVDSSPLQEYDFSTDEQVYNTITKEESHYAEAGELKDSLYEGSNKKYVPAQIRVIDNSQCIRLQIADAITGELRRELTRTSDDKVLVKGIRKFASTEEAPVESDALVKAPIVTDSVVNCLVATLEGIKADVNDLVSEQIRMLAIAQALADRINNL